MEIVPISSLSPSSAIPSDRGFKAVVTLLWPFSSATGQCALLLADPDARQRYQKGQVRVRFTGPSAHQIAASGIGIGDSVHVGLVGAQWLTESNTALVRTPGKSVDGELIFKNRLHISVQRRDNEPKIIDVDESTQPASPKPSMLPPSTPVARTSSRPSFDAYGVAVYSSPAFMKRLRLSEGKTPYTPVSVSEDDDLDTIASRKRRRVSYKNVTEWKFDAREPSPEKEQDTTMEDMQDLVQTTTDPVNVPTEEPAVVPQGVAEPATTSVDEVMDHASTAGIVEEATSETSNAEEPTGTSLVEEVVHEPTKPALQEPIIVEGEPQAEQSSAPQVQSNMPPLALPRLDIPSTPSKTLQTMQLDQNFDRPITPILQPITTEGLPLPSPFPTSAHKIPSPTFSHALGGSEITTKIATEAVQPSSQEEDTEQSVVQDSAAPAASEENSTAGQVQPTSTVSNGAARKESVVELVGDATPESQPQAVQTGENEDASGNSPEIETSVDPTSKAEAIGETLEPSTKMRKTSADPSQDASSHSEESTARESRVVTDTYDDVSSMIQSDEDEDEEDKESKEGLATGSSPIIEDVEIGWRSRGDRWDDESSIEGQDSEEESESSSDDSEEDLASESEYNSEQIAALQEESDEEGAIEEPDWDYLESKLQQEENALHEAREDITARDPRKAGTSDYFQRHEADDTMMHDDGSESDEYMEPRSDDDDNINGNLSDFDIESQDVAHAILPGTEEESSDESEAELRDQSYQPSMPERDMYSHPFGLQAAHSPNEAETALPSRDESEDEFPAGDETMAWRARDAAMQEVRRQQPQLQSTTKTNESPLPTQNAPPPSSRLAVVELLSDSDSDEEDEEPAAPAQPQQPVPQQHPALEPTHVQTIRFAPSLETVKQVLGNKEKDAHLNFTGQATAQIRAEVRNIASRVNSQDTRWTKFNALKTICQIGVQVAAASPGNYFAEGVKYRLKDDEVLVNACWKVYNELADEDKSAERQPPDILDALQELLDKKDYCFEGFAGFLKHFNQKRDEVVPVKAEQEQQMQQAADVKPDAAIGKEEEFAQQTAVGRQSQQEEAPVSQIGEENPASLAQTGFAIPAIQPADLTLPGNGNNADKVQEQPVVQEMTEPDEPQAVPEEVALSTDDMVVPQSPQTDEEAEQQPEVEQDQAEAISVERDNTVNEGPVVPEQIVEEHDASQADDHPNPMQVDATMSDVPEPDSLSAMNEGNVEQQDEQHEQAEVPDVLMADESAQHSQEAQETQEVEETFTQQADEPFVPQTDVDDPSENEIKPSIEGGLEDYKMTQTDNVKTEAPQLPTSDSVQPKDEDTHQLSSSSFRTLSPTPAPAATEEPRSAPPISEIGPPSASQLLNNPIEELDLSQVEPPSWSARFSQFSQSVRSSRTHTRSETIPDSTDDEAIDLVATGSSEPASPEPEPMTQVSRPQSAQKPLGANMVQPSQELGTAFSQFPKQAPGPSTLQSQLPAIEETPSPHDQEDADEEIKSQVGLDDELLADYVQVPSKPEAIPTTPKLAVAPMAPKPQVTPATPLSTSTKKPARPLTLFKGRRSVGSRLSIGGNIEQQAVRDETMQDAPAQEREKSPAAEKGTQGKSNGKDLAQTEVGVDAPARQSSPTPAAAENDKQRESASATASNKEPSPTAATQKDPSPPPQHRQPTTITTNKAATSNFQLKPTLKPFAEVEASLFGTPAKPSASLPQEPHSAPAPTWRNTLTSKMSDVPLIGSWFTPRKPSAAPKAATEIKRQATSSRSTAETPTKGPTERQISPPPLSRYASQGTSTSLSYFAPLPALSSKLNQQGPEGLADVLAVCTSTTTPPVQAKSGAKDFYTVFWILDEALNSHNSASQTESEKGVNKHVRVQVFRPWKSSLPVAARGDVVLLRGFAVRSREHKSFLVSTAASAWCVWRYEDGVGEEQEQDDRPIWARKGNTQNEAGGLGVMEEIKGPPVEIGDEEREKVKEVRKWWDGVQEGKKEHDGDLIVIED